MGILLFVYSFYTDGLALDLSFRKFLHSANS